MIYIWKDILGFEGKYEINEYGIVRSKERYSCGDKIYRHTPERILKPCKVGKGYLTVCLRDGKKTYRKYLHQMVAECFVERPNGSCIVNHIDGNKKNNYYTNLEWVTYSENNQHAYDKNLKSRGEKFYNAVLTEADVKTILANGKYTTYQNIADKYGVSKATIRDVLLRRTWKHICIN